MKVYVFGNQDFIPDSFAFDVEKNLGSTGVGVGCGVGRKNLTVNFINVKPNEDLPFANEARVVLIDTVQALNKVQVFTKKDLAGIVLSPRTSAHDFDLNFQLNYLKKLGKLKKVTIIGIPMRRLTNKDYNLIQSILRKLVAQDMQGS